jgi:hypothetical protein
MAELKPLRDVRAANADQTVEQSAELSLNFGDGLKDQAAAWA